MMRGIYPGELDIVEEEGLLGDEDYIFTFIMDSPKDFDDFLTTFKLDEIRRYTDDFRHPIGEGTNMFRGIIFGRNYDIEGLNYKEIAVKVLPQDVLHRGIWTREIEIFKKFRDHPNIITLIGTCETNMRLFLIFPFIPRGDLFHCISSRDLKWQQALKIFEGTVKAIHGLHHYPLILCNDLNPKNILVNEDFQPLLCDFSSACSPLIAKLSHVSRGYVEPILGNSGMPDTRTDIYAIGLLILQVLMKANVQIDQYGLVVKSVLEMVKELQNNNEGVIVHQDLISSGCTAPEATRRITNLAFNCLNGEREGSEVSDLLGRTQGVETRFSVEEILRELRAIRKDFPHINAESPQIEKESSQIDEESAQINEPSVHACLPCCTCFLCGQTN